MIDRTGPLVMGQVIAGQHLGQRLTFRRIKIQQRVIHIQQKTGIVCHNYS